MHVSWLDALPATFAFIIASACTLTRQWQPQHALPSTHCHPPRSAAIPRPLVRCRGQAASWILGQAFPKLRLPLISGYLLIGIAVGPYMTDLITEYYVYLLKGLRRGPVPPLEALLLETPPLSTDRLARPAFISDGLGCHLAAGGACVLRALRRRPSAPTLRCALSLPHLCRAGFINSFALAFISFAAGEEIFFAELRPPPHRTSGPLPPFKRALHSRLTPMRLTSVQAAAACHRRADGRDRPRHVRRHHAGDSPAAVPAALAASRRTFASP